MAVAATRGTQLTVDTLVLRAYQKAGIIRHGATATDAGVAEQLAYGRFVLNTLVAEAGGFELARHVQELVVSLVVDQQDYDLPEAVLGVIGDGMYISASQTADTSTGETLVKQISGEQWQRLSDKGNSGRPTQLYVDRGGDDYVSTLKLWHRPSEAGSLRLRCHYKAADTLDGSTTVDLQATSMRYLVAAVAADVLNSSNGSAQRVALLTREADMAFDKLRSFEAEQMPPPIILNLHHPQRRM